MRVVIADDSVLLREGAARLLEDAGFDVVGQAGDAEDLLRKVRAHKPDVAIVDIRMPPDNTDEGLRAAQAIRAELPGRRRARALAVRRGALRGELLGRRHRGRRLPAQGPRRRGRALRRGGAARRRTAARCSTPRSWPRCSGREGRPADALTEREREVLALMAEGRTNRAIAETIFVSERAVERHVTAIFSKLGLEATGQDHRRVLAVLRYLQA